MGSFCQVPVGFLVVNADACLLALDFEPSGGLFRSLFPLG